MRRRPRAARIPVTIAGEFSTAKSEHSEVFWGARQPRARGILWCGIGREVESVSTHRAHPLPHPCANITTWKGLLAGVLRSAESFSRLQSIDGCRQTAAQDAVQKSMGVPSPIESKLGDSRLKGPTPNRDAILDGAKGVLIG